MVVLRKRSSRFAAVGAAAFPVGTEVEVQMSDDGFKGAWYEATVTNVYPERRRFNVVYTSLVADDESLRPRKERVDYSNIRPRPPRLSADARYKLYQIVDVYYNDGWWLGVVSTVGGGDPPTRYTVTFPSAREAADFCPSVIRMRQNWRHEQWCPADGSNQVGALFGMGKPVEVCYDEQKYGTVWYTGTVKKVIERTIFLVEYKKSKEDGSSSMTTEILDAHYLRPVPPPTPKDKVFGLLDKVEICLCGGWVTGVVMKVVDGLKYVVELTNGKEEEIELGHNEIRVCRYWDGRWNYSYKNHGRSSLPTKAHTPTTLSPGLKRKMGEGLYFEGQAKTLRPCKQKKEGDTSEQPCLKIVPRTTAVEIKLPDAAKGTASPHIELTMGNESEKMAHQLDPAHTRSAVKRIPFVKNSFLWKSIESMEIFNIMPQDPCFRQLEELSEEIREGMAIGLMVTFANLASRVEKLVINDSDATFKEMLEALVPLEKNGFDVGLVRSRIDELLKIKVYQRQFKNKKTALEEQMLAKEYEESRLGTQNCALDKTIAEVERQLASLREERDSVNSQRMTSRSEMAKLQKDAQAAEEAYLSAESRFATILASPW